MTVEGCEREKNMYTHFILTLLYCYTHIHTYIHTYAHMHTYIHTYTHAYIHSHIRTHAYIHSHTHTHTYRWYISLHHHMSLVPGTVVHTHTHIYTYHHTHIDGIFYYIITCPWGLVLVWTHIKINIKNI